MDAHGLLRDKALGQPPQIERSLCEPAEYPIRREHGTDSIAGRGRFATARALTVLGSRAPSHPGSWLTQRASDPLGYGLASLY
jgi:hypothetical protein